MHTNFRTGEWFGSTTELAEYTGMSRTTATKAVKRFVEIGLVDPVEPFGPNRQGALRLLCYDLLVTDAIPAVREMLAEGRELATKHF